MSQLCGLDSPAAMARELADAETRPVYSRRISSKSHPARSPWRSAILNRVRRPTPRAGIRRLSLPPAAGRRVARSGRAFRRRTPTTCETAWRRVCAWFRWRGKASRRTGCRRPAAATRTTQAWRRCGRCSAARASARSPGPAVSRASP